MPLTDKQAEQETVIRQGYADDGSQVVSIYSTQRAVWRKAERAGWKEVMRDGGGREYEAPAEQFRYSLRTGQSARDERARRAQVLRARFASKTPVRVEDLEPGRDSGDGRT